MKGFLEAMQDGTIDEKDYPEYIGIVLGETRRMVAMVNDLLDLSRIESGMIELHYETFDINELVRRTLITSRARQAGRRETGRKRSAETRRIRREHGTGRKDLDGVRDREGCVFGRRGCGFDHYRHSGRAG